MKKYLLPLVMFLLSASTLFAASVDVNQAKQVAQNFYGQITGKPLSLTLTYQALNEDPTNGVPLGEPLYYVFNVEADKGFVMISAEDQVKPVIGYNTQGQFKIQNAPPVIADWFAKYSKQIAYAKANPVVASADVTAQWSNLYNNVANTAKGLRSGGVVAPLCNTTWDQDLYYNALCPSDPNSPNGYGGNVPTGCGATAMSQIMRYWSYPPTGTGNNSYNSNYGTLSANFGATTYNWTNMPDYLTGPNSDVATIMFDCGVAVDMVYSADESTSYILTADNAVSCQAAYTTYFGYDPATMQGYKRANYTDANWSTMIQNELNAARPIQYAGQGPQGGHTFVLDGSDGAGDFHINWGWSGADNGYYTFNNLVPAPNPNGSFDAGEEMLNGIQPLNITPTTADIVLDSAIYAVPNPVGFGVEVNVDASLLNNGSTAFSGDFCAALFDANGNFLRYIGAILTTGANPLQAGYYYAPGLQFTDTCTGVTAPGTYTIGIYYLPTGQNNWILAGENSFTNPISVVYTGPTNSLISLYTDMTPSPATFFQGEAASVTVNLINNGTAAYTGEYEVALLDLFGNIVEVIGTYTESTGLPVNDIYNPALVFSTSSITAPEGQYFLGIGEEQSGTSQLYYCGATNYPNPIPISVINSGFQVSVNDTRLNNIKVYPNPATDHIYIDAGEAAGNYTLKIFDAIGNQVTESNGELNGQLLSEDVKGFASGVYIIQLKTEQGMLNVKFVVR